MQLNDVTSNNNEMTTKQQRKREKISQTWTTSPQFCFRFFPLPFLVLHYYFSSLFQCFCSSVLFYLILPLCLTKNLWCGLLSMLKVYSLHTSWLTMIVSWTDGQKRALVVLHNFTADTTRFSFLFQDFFPAFLFLSIIFFHHESLSCTFIFFGFHLV